jgi:hypothetical protein
MAPSPESKVKEGKRKKSSLKSPKHQPLPCLVQAKDLLISKALAYAEVDSSLLEVDYLDVMAWTTSGSQRVRVGSSILVVQTLTFWVCRAFTPLLRRRRALSCYVSGVKLC